MGCGASVKPPRELNDDEVQEMCQLGAKEMQILCVTAAMSDPDKIVVPPPDCVNSYRQNAQRLRDAAEEAKETITEFSSGDQAQSLAEKVGGGKVLGFMAGLVDRATEIAGQGAGAAVSGSLNLMATGIDACIDKIQDPFTDVGKAIVKAKKTQMMGVYADYINNQTIKDAAKLVRCRPPYGPDEYNDCASDAVSQHLTDSAAGPLAEKLLPIVQEEIDNHAITKAWDDVMETAVAAHEKISQYAALSKFGIEKPELDINVYIVSQTILAIGKLMGEAEAAARQSPAGKSRTPETFAVVFSGEKMTETHWNNRGK